MSEAGVITSDVTCLGCGCACDDIAVVVRDGRIVETRNACALGTHWFGDGAVPSAIRSGERDASLDQALADAAAILSAARRVLVYLAPGVSCDAQRAAVAIADQLHGTIDSISSSTVAAGILAGQRRGRIAATLGELRNRADLLVFWGVDPAERYPRFTTRYAVEPTGAFVPKGRASRTVLAVDVGERRGPRDADRRVSVDAATELDLAAAVRAKAAGHTLGAGASGLAEHAAALAQAFAAARYAAVVYDGEPDAGATAPGRAEALTLLTQSLNAAGRCSLVTLRAGGNRGGADAVLTWQTGFPMTVDFSRGTPRYRPDEGAAAWLENGAVDVMLCVGDAREMAALPAGAARRVLIGPHASTIGPAAVAIDTGVAGIHSGGVAYRMDDVPLPLRASLTGALDAADVVSALLQRVSP